MPIPSNLSLSPSNPQFADEFLKYIASATVSFEDYPKLLKILRAHKEQSIDKYNNFTKQLLTIQESNDLLKSLVFFNVSKSEERYEIMLKSFHKYLKSNDQNVTLFDDQRHSSFFECKRDGDALHYIYKWSYFFKTGEELLYCDECDSLLVPTFKKLDTYVCGNADCTQFNKTRYHNHCWNCNSSIDSRFNAQCSSCGWYICNTCGSCEEGLAGGCKEQKKKEEPLKKYYQMSPLGEDFPKVFSLWNSIIECYRKMSGKRSGAWKNANTQRGTKILKSEMELYQYGTLYYGHHIAKLRSAFEKLNMKDFSGKKLEVFDWGCGQALATLCFLEKYQSSENSISNIMKIHLIEPSEISLSKGRNFIEDKFQVDNSRFDCICKSFDDINDSILQNNDSAIQVHLMSNILDVDKFSIEKFINAHSGQTKHRKYYICVSPNYPKARERICRFFEGMSSSGHASLISKDDCNIRAKIYDIKKNDFADKYVKRFQIVFSIN